MYSWESLSPSRLNQGKGTPGGVLESGRLATFSGRRLRFSLYLIARSAQRKVSIGRFNTTLQLASILAIDTVEV